MRIVPTVLVILMTSLGLAQAASRVNEIPILAGRPRPVPGQLPEPAIPAVAKPMQIIALALAVAPGVLGFVLFVLMRNALHLLLFNGGALALGVWHIMNFENAR